MKNTINSAEKNEITNALKTGIQGFNEYLIQTLTQIFQRLLEDRIAFVTAYYKEKLELNTDTSSLNGDNSNAILRAIVSEITIKEFDKLWHRASAEHIIEKLSTIIIDSIDLNTDEISVLDYINNDDVKHPDFDNWLHHIKDDMNVLIIPDDMLLSMEEDFGILLNILAK